jgi:hypothetical protein
MTPKRLTWAGVYRFLFGLGWTLLSGAGLVGSVSGKTGVSGPWPLWVVFGAIGIWILVSPLRSLRSPEARAKRLARVPLPMGRPVAPALAYRAPATRERTTAREAYAPALSTLPLRLLPLRAGKVLPYALRIQEGAGAWILLGFTILWNLCTFPFFVHTIAEGSLGGAAFASLFVLAGVVLVVASVHTLLGRRKLARVEIDAEPVFASDDLEVLVEQRGPVVINRITATLRCEERATYTVGTDTKTDKHVLHTLPVFEEEMITVARARPWSRRVRVRIPEGPCSFKSDKNEVAWLLVLAADIASWPDYEEAFELRVVPRVMPGDAS